MNVKDSTSFEGTILFKFRGENGECVTSYAVQIDEDREVSTVKNYDASNRSKLTEVGISEDDFLWLYSGKASSSDVAKLFYSGRLSISGYAFRKVSNFAQSFDFSSEKWRQFYAWKEDMENRQRSPSATEEMANVGSPSRDFWFYSCRAILARYRFSHLQRLQWEVSMASIFGEKYVVEKACESIRRRNRSLLVQNPTDELHALVSNVAGTHIPLQKERRRAMSWDSSMCGCRSYDVQRELHDFFHPRKDNAALAKKAWTVEKPKDLMDIFDAVDSNYVEAVKHSAKERFQLRQSRDRIDLAHAGLNQLDKLLVAMGREGHYNVKKKTKAKYISAPELLLREINVQAMEVMDILKAKALGRQPVDKIPTPDVNALLGGGPSMLVVDKRATPENTSAPNSTWGLGQDGVFVKVNRSNIQRRGSKRDFEIPKERIKQKLVSLQTHLANHKRSTTSVASLDDHLVFSDYLQPKCHEYYLFNTCVPQQQRALSDFARRQSIKDVRNLEDGAHVAVGGWVKSVRKHKSVNFVNINDGTCLAEMQITLPVDDGEDHAAKLGIDLSTVTVGSSVYAEGTLREVPGGKQKRVELHPESMRVTGTCDAQTYPLQKKYHSLEFLRENLHLRARTNTIGAVTRVRNALSMGLHQYFQENEFLQLHSPILTSNDCEGAGEQFRLTKTDGKDDFFGTPTYLTVSGQLHAEMFACSMGKVYTFGPTFRAENSNTTRHLAEFWMVEPEMAFAGLDECIASAQGAVQRSVRHAMDTCADDLAFFQKTYDKTLEERLAKTTESDFARLTYTEAIEVLQKAKKVKFQTPPVWGMDLQTEHERYLAEKYVGGPVFVTDYPASIKAFYMRLNDNEAEGRETVAGMDLLVPKIGELVGGSVREERVDILEAKMRRLGLLHDRTDSEVASDSGDLDWYLDLRRFGTVPHAGWGLGFERLVLYATGMENIRDVIPIPRFPGQCKH
ncbi:TPA: hypothetical protein N0F65_002645 [Lagenidium giganteum]|uniref:asparagine--tRNA ligase n=1 Tax=Lagenidium giganteum TaxID=4803 RepID=A0AAV2Z5G2_9STRA|nr:TPA: hypothetical protein N0F65_002645 [Lagenidium giganteum]